MAEKRSMKWSQMMKTKYILSLLAAAFPSSSASDVLSCSMLISRTSPVSSTMVLMESGSSRVSSVLDGCFLLLPLLPDAAGLQSKASSSDEVREGTVTFLFALLCLLGAAFSAGGFTVFLALALLLLCFLGTSSGPLHCAWGAASESLSSLNSTCDGIYRQLLMKQSFYFVYFDRYSKQDKGCLEYASVIKTNMTMNVLKRLRDSKGKNKLNFIKTI